MSDTPWNWCRKCKQLVDADDIFDGSEVTCIGCGGRFICVAYTDGSWRLEYIPRSRPTKPHPQKRRRP